MHDVGPEHLAFLADLLGDLSDRRVPALNVAVVPDFHGRASWTDDAIRHALAGPLSGIRTEILLHGCFHARVGSNGNLAGWRRLRSQLQSAGEDEFYALGTREAEDRVRYGSRVVETAFGRKPGVFVPPAWSGSRRLRDVLRGLGFLVTEDHFWLYDLQHRRRRFSPVIAFATRSAWRAGLSKIWARAVMRAPAPGTVLRFAFHPADYRSPGIRSFALDLVTELTRTHEWGLYSEVLGSGDGREPDMSRPISRLSSDAPRADAS